jgi:hypothetical protein
MGSQCCSGQCVNGVCGGVVVIDAGTPPPVCGVPPGANQCDVCLATSCCMQLVGCESNATCAASQKCFDSCYSGPGSGLKCYQSCSQMFPSSQGQVLVQCAAQSCVSQCQ